MHGSTAGVCIGQLPAGDHTFDVQYRTPAAGVSNYPGGNDWNGRALNVAVLSCEAAAPSKAVKLVAGGAQAAP